MSGRVGDPIGTPRLNEFMLKTLMALTLSSDVRAQNSIDMFKDMVQMTGWRFPHRYLYSDNHKSIPNSYSESYRL